MFSFVSICFPPRSVSRADFLPSPSRVLVVRLLVRRVARPGLAYLRGSQLVIVLARGDCNDGAGPGRLGRGRGLGRRRLLRRRRLARLRLPSE